MRRSSSSSGTPSPPGKEGKEVDKGGDEADDPFKSFRYKGEEGGDSLDGGAGSVNTTAAITTTTAIKVEQQKRVYKKRRSPGSSLSSSAASGDVFAKTGPSSPPSSSSVTPARLTEKYSSPGKPEVPLRLLLVGHNPSDHAWTSVHYYSNPSNRMWKLLSGTGIVPTHFTATNDDECPWSCGVGFTDLGSGNPGTKSSAFSSAILRSWRQSLYQRIQAHADRAGAPPRVVAFTGKRQFKEIMFDHPAVAQKKDVLDYGLQDLRPLGWPFLKEEVEVFVLTSSSGASALTNEVREAPYRELARLLESIGPWTTAARAPSLASSPSPQAKGSGEVMSMVVVEEEEVVVSSVKAEEVTQ